MISQDHYPEVENPSFRLLAVSMALIAVLASFMFFWRLGDKPLENWDEGIHAEVTREMYREGHMFSMTYREQLYTAKPPLRFWMTAAVFPVFGQTAFALRFWSAIAGIATALLITFWMFRISNSLRLSFLAGALFVTGRFVLYHAFRTGETDGLLVLFLTAAMFAYWKSIRSPRWLYAFGGLVGLAIMTKSFAGLIPVIVMAIDCTLARRWSRYGIKVVAIAAGIAAVVAAPWHIFELIRNGKTFWDGYFGFHVLDRATEVLYKNNVSWFWYAEVMFKRMFPFGVFIPLAVLLSARRWLMKRDALDRLLLIWFVTVFVLFSFVRTKFDWYLLPLYAPLVMILSRGCSEFLHQEKDRPLVWATVASFFAGAYVLPLGIAHVGILWKLTPYAYLPSSFADTFSGRTIVAAAITALSVGITLLLKTQTIVKPTRAVGMVTIVYLLVIAGGWQYSYIKHLPTTAPLKDMAAKLSTMQVKDVDVVGINLVTQPAGDYYLRSVSGLTVHELKQADAVSHDLILTDANSPLYDSVRGMGSAILERDHFALIQRPVMAQ